MGNTTTGEDLQQKLTKRIKNSAQIIEVFGLIAVVGSIALFFITGGTISSTILVNVLIGVVVVGLGWQIRKDATSLDTKQKLYYIVLGLAVIIFVTNILAKNLGLGLGLSAFLLGASVNGLDSVRKLRNPAARAREQAAQNLKGKEKVKDVLLMVLIGGAVIGGIILVAYFLNR